MAIEKVTPAALFFRCPACDTVNEVQFHDVKIRAREDKYNMILPPCACGARSSIVPGKVEETSRNHARRIAWRRAVAAGNYFDAVSRANAVAHTEQIVAFYDHPGREALRAQFLDDGLTVKLLETEKKG